LIGNISVQVSDKPENSVLKQNPKTGIEVEKGSQVNVVIAVKPEKVKVPNVTGLYSRKAYEILNDSKLVAGKITEEISDAAPGTVLKQKPKVGTEVDPGSAVEMTIAKASEMTMVPGIVELSRDKAVEVLAKAKLSLGQVIEKVSDAEPGTVLEQKPKAGTEVKIDSFVDIVIAIKSVRVNVPNLVGKADIEAAKILKASGLTMGGTTKKLSTKPTGTVLSQSPQPGSIVVLDASVSIVVAERRRIIKVIVPNFVQKTTAEVEVLLDTSKLKPGNITLVSSRAPKGTVVSQKPAAGTRVLSGSRIDMNVSRGRIR